MRYEHVISEATSRPWAILPEKLSIISRFLSLKAAGGEVDAAEIEAMRAAAAQRANPRAPGMVAVLPMVGTIAPRANMMTDLSGGVSLDRWMQAFRAAMADPNIKALVVDMDSPGGYSDGVQEAADEIFSMRGQKPMVAVANTMSASAAYWIASAMGEIVASPSSLTGSIGVYMMHVDQSAANEQMGVKPTFISAGKYKVSGNPHEPLTEEARAMMQDRVDQTYDSFVGAVARGRGVGKDAVRSGYGQGRVLGAKDALAAGLVDRIATLNDTIARYAGGSAVGTMRAEMVSEPIAAERTPKHALRHRQSAAIPRTR